MSENTLSDFLSFRKMITPIIIQVVFWIAVIISVLAGLMSIVESFDARYGGAELFVTGLFMIFLMPLVIRIYAELIIIFFLMNETLTDIKNNTER